MRLLEKLLGNQGLPKTPIPFEETKKYNCQDYTIEPVEIEGKFKYYVRPIPKKEETQPDPSKLQKESFRKKITQNGKLQGIDRKVYGNWKENIKPKHYKTFEQEEKEND